MAVIRPESIGEYEIIFIDNTGDIWVSLPGNPPTLSMVNGGPALQNLTHEYLEEEFGPLIEFRRQEDQ